MNSCLWISLLSVTLCTMSAQVITPEIPVLDTTPGIRFLPATPKPPVTLEMYIDLHCSDSLAQWQILKPVQIHFGTDKLDLVVQVMSLTYFRNSFLASQGLFLIQNSSVSANLFAYIEESMNMWRNFSTSATVDMTETEVLEMLADMANRVTGIDRTFFKSNISQYYGVARAVWKFAVKHGVAGTPTFFLNGVDLGIGSKTPSFNDWVTYLDPIINS